MAREFRAHSSLRVADGGPRRCVAERCKHVVGTVAEIPPGQRRIVELEGRSIGVFNVGGAFYALRNACPHQSGPLCRGQITGLLGASDQKHLELSREGEIVRCPWHGWEFDITSGR